MKIPVSHVSLKLSGVVFLTVGALLLAGCGDSDDSDDPGTTTEAPATTGANGADDGQTGSIDRAAAEKIALAAVGVGTVTDSGPEDDRGAAWEIEVTRPNGSEVDVLVAADGSVIDQIEQGQSDDTSEPGAQGPDDGGGGNQGAVSRQQAAQAALAHVGSGSVTYISREDDRGATWEIEITKPDGSEIDVLVAADGSIIE